MGFEVMDAYGKAAVIKVIGIGGGGGNAVQHMVESEIDGVEFVCANTDAQALKASTVKTVLQLGGEITRGLGAGAKPEVGKRAAEADSNRIKEMLSGADMVFITAGMGGGTGTGAAPIVAEIAKDMGILTVAVVTLPFKFEGNRRRAHADVGVRELSQHVDSLIIVPNDKLLPVLGPEISMLDAFKAANDVLRGAVLGIAELITHPGVINVDFADVRTVMSEMGMAMMGTGRGRGANRARDAAAGAIASPLLEDINLSGAKGILVNITAGADLSLQEFNDVGDIVSEFASDDATVVVGTVLDPTTDGEVRVTVVATGISQVAQFGTPPEPVRAVPSQATAAAPSIAVIAPAAAPVVPAAPAPTKATHPDYKGFDTPPAQRRGGAEPREGQGSSGATTTNFLDIPAFLRRQAD